MKQDRSALNQGHGLTALITGASAGIGRALAVALAAPRVTLHLGGRDAARLDEVAALCRARGAEAICHVVTVDDADAMTAWINAVGRLDLVFANAGIGAGSENGRPEPAAQVRQIFHTNLDGALNTILPALTLMEQQEPGPDGKRGRIAVIASIAAFVPAPNAASYCASKAALDRWTVATAHHAQTLGVALTSVCPGYVRTDMTSRNRFPMPGIMSAERAAALILKGVWAGQRRVAFPWWLAGLARCVGALPPSWSGALLAAPPGKAALLDRANHSGESS